MKCAFCGAEATPGTTTITLERDGATIVFRNVPAIVCGQCGEPWLAADVTDSLRVKFNALLAAGVTIAVNDYREAA